MESDWSQVAAVGDLCASHVLASQSEDPSKKSTYHRHQHQLLRATITQPVGNRIARGSVPQYRTWTCTGQTQPRSALIPADVAGVPFRTGEAPLFAWVSSCPGANCEYAETQQVARIIR